MKTIRERILEQPTLSNTPGIGQMVALLEDEFRSLHKAIENKARNTVVDTVELLHPQYRNRKPPVVSLAVLETEQQQRLILESLFQARMGESSFRFAPVYEGAVYPLQVQYLVANDQWWEQQTVGIMPKQYLEGKMAGRLILGLTSNDADQTQHSKCTELDGLQLFFEGLEEKYIQFLPLAEVMLGNTKYALEPASFKGNGFVATHTLDKEFLNLYQHRRKAANQFPRLFRLRKTTERVFEALEPPSELADLKEVQWLNIKLPEAIPDTACNSLEIQANVFPLWNTRRLRLTRNCNRREIVVPIELAENEAFFGIQRIWSNSERPYTARGIFPGEQETYELHSRDPRKLNSIDLEKLTTTFVREIKEKIDLSGLAALSLDHNDVLQPYKDSLEILKSLESIGEKGHPLKIELSGLERKQYYLKLKPAVDSLVVHIDFLTTQASAHEILWRQETNLETDVVHAAKLITKPQQYSREITFQEQLDYVKERFDFLKNGSKYE